MDVLSKYKDRLIGLADRLVAEETLEQDEFEKLFEDLPDPRKERGSPTPLPLEGAPGRPARTPEGRPAPKPSPQPA